jgi:hypothetical protein
MVVRAFVNDDGAVCHVTGTRQVARLCVSHCKHESSTFAERRLQATFVQHR